MREWGEVGGSVAGACQLTGTCASSNGDDPVTTGKQKFIITK